jgi:glycosyltransferase involved in cell wall biosynthesis
MRAAIHNPYLDTLGGGERYTVSFAKVLIDLGWQVDVEWKNPAIGGALSRRFGIDLTGINFIPDVKRGDGYDLIFWVSDGSIPALKSRKNFLHFQVPFHHVGGGSLLNKMKLFRVNKIICNSLFTKKIIDSEYGVESIVIYPPVDTGQIKPKRKENIILNVARFSGLLQSKGHEILVRAFKKMVDSGVTGWKLVIAGGAEVGVIDQIKKLKKLSENYPIEIIKNPDFKSLKDLYGRAKIFWSASGYGEDEEKNPEKVEHFGITAAESMAAGAVPVLYNAGGYKEIVTDSVNGFLWSSVSELIKKTRNLIYNRNPMAKKAQESSKTYSYEKFKTDIGKIL